MHRPLQGIDTGRQAPGRESWPKFYATCAGRRGAPAPLPAAVAASAESWAKRPISLAYATFIGRERQYGKLWRAAKAAGKTAGKSWPKYLSSCNAKLTAQGK